MALIIEEKPNKTLHIALFIEEKLNKFPILVNCFV